jgi:hypothetical protein
MVVVLAAVAMIAIGGSVVLAAIPTGGGTIYACYSKTTGAMRVVNYPTVRCASSERLLSWTQVGSKAPPLASIGIKNVSNVGNDYALGPAPGEILRVWMETGSASEACLATMGEANHAPTVQTLYCSSRNVTLADGKKHWGVALTLFLAGPLVDVAAPEGAVNWDPKSWYSVNVYQEGAKFFGNPIRCDKDGC